MSDLNSWRILLVDDDQDDYLLTHGMLRASQTRRIDVDWRDSYLNGMQAITEGQPYDAALIDYDLGEHSGIRFIREANERGCDFPLILYTGRGSHEVDMEAMEAGATLYLTKTEANPLLLERVIRYAIERKQGELSLQRATSELEQRVAERTEALRVANAQLRAEISERQAAERALTERETTLTQMLESLPVGVWLIDHAGQIRQGNRAGIQIWGGVHFVGPEDYHVYKGWRTDTGQPLAPEEWAALRVLASGQPLEEELEIEAFDGQRKIIWSSAVPLHDGQHKISGAIVVNQDITERKQAQQTLHRQHELLETTFNNVYLALAVLDRDFNFVRVNHTYAASGNRSEDFFTGKNHFDLYPSAENEAIFRHVVETGQPFQTLSKPFECSEQPEHGITFWDWSLQPMLDPSGAVNGLLLTVLNGTDRQEG